MDVNCELQSTTSDRFSVGVSSDRPLDVIRLECFIHEKIAGRRKSVKNENVRWWAIKKRINIHDWNEKLVRLMMFHSLSNTMPRSASVSQMNKKTKIIKQIVIKWSIWEGEEESLLAHMISKRDVVGGWKNLRIYDLARSAGIVDIPLPRRWFTKRFLCSNVRSVMIRECRSMLENSSTMICFWHDNCAKFQLKFLPWITRKFYNVGLERRGKFSNLFPTFPQQFNPADARNSFPCEKSHFLVAQDFNDTFSTADVELMNTAGREI